jgi:hypothetical protein
MEIATGPGGTTIRVDVPVRLEPAERRGGRRKERRVADSTH